MSDEETLVALNRLPLPIRVIYLVLAAPKATWPLQQLADMFGVTEDDVLGALVEAAEVGRLAGLPLLSVDMENRAVGASSTVAAHPETFALVVDVLETQRCGVSDAELAGLLG